MLPSHKIENVAPGQGGERLGKGIPPLFVLRNRPETDVVALTSKAYWGVEVPTPTLPVSSMVKRAVPAVAKAAVPLEVERQGSNVKGVETVATR